MATPTRGSKVLSAITVFALIVGIVGPTAFPQTAYAATIFSDGFESNSFSAWTSADGDWDVISDDHTGLYGAEVKDTGSSSDELRKDVSTSGYTAVTLTYWYKIPAGLSSDDELYVQWYDGSTWQTIVNYDSSATVANWVQATHVLPAGANNNANFRLQFSGDSLSSSDKFRLDDVALTGTALPPPNIPPVALAGVASTDEDTAVVIPLSATDLNGDPLTYSIVTAPSNGTLSGSGASRTYTPNADYSGSDSFTFKANDGLADSNNALVLITVNPVNDAPVANDDAYSTPEDTELLVSAPGVLANDGDIDSGSVTPSVVAPASNGTVTLNPDGSFSYLPNTGFSGVDTFTYTLDDGFLTCVTAATVTINVSSVNVTPVANDDSYSTPEDTALVEGAAGVLTNDTDGDADPLTAVLDSTTTNGVLVLNADGSFTYTPNVGFNGVDSFTYKANDGTLSSSVATVSITVSPVNDAPVAVDDAYGTNEDTALVVPAAGVLGNDTDGESDPLSATVVLGPTSGVLVLNADGSFTYTPNADFNGSDSFTYTAGDGVDTSSAATVTLTITSVLDVCEDGVDNDGDSLTDYPADVGCASATDNDETDTPTPPAAQCADGIDNDGDTLVDYPSDLGCVDALDNDETDPAPAPAAPTSPSAPILGGGVIGLTGSVGGGSVLGVSIAAPTGQVLGASCGLYLDKYIRAGRNNDVEQVKKLQEFLNKHEGATLPVTGFYGPMTVAAVQAFQERYASEVLAPWGISLPTGIVYRTTLYKINMIECPELSLTLPPLIEWSRAEDPAIPR